jgi:hypothetical protein
MKLALRNFMRAVGHIEIDRPTGHSDAASFVGTPVVGLYSEIRA